MNGILMTIALATIVRRLHSASVRLSEREIVYEVAESGTEADGALSFPRRRALYWWKHADRFAVERRVWSEAIVVWDGSDTATVVSDRRLTDDDYRSTLDAWSNWRLNFTYIRLACGGGGSLTNSGQYSCVCAHFRNVSKHENNSSSSNNNNNDYTWVSIGQTTCNGPPKLSDEVFEGFEHALVLEMSTVTIPELRMDMFTHFRYLKLIYVSDVRVTGAVPEIAAASSVVCPTSFALKTIYLNRVRSERGNNTVDELFRCRYVRPQTGTSSPPPPTRRPLTRYQQTRGIIAIHAVGCGLTRLTRDTFSGIVPLAVANFSDNLIATLAADTFESLALLSELDLSNNRLTEFSNVDFPVGSYLQHLNLANNAIDRFDAGDYAMLRSLVVLNLAGNRLAAVDGSFDALVQIAGVFLHDNGITRVGDRMFANCSELVVVDLHNNSIGEIRRDAFAFSSDWTDVGLSLNLSYNRISDATMLREAVWELDLLSDLNLRHNRLTRLEPNMFRRSGSGGGASLLELVLSDNLIADVDRAAFNDLAALGVLFLDQNNISGLHEDTFRHVPSLSLLSLSGNGIRRLPKGIFEANEKLQYLRLDDNRIASLPSDIKMPAALSVLMMANNGLTTLPLFDTPLPNLVGLGLSGNFFRNVSNNSFARYGKLKELDIRNCSIEHLEPGAFFANPSLVGLQMSDNPRLGYDPSVRYLFVSYRDDFELELDNVGLTTAAKLFAHDLRFARILSVSGNDLRTFPDQSPDVTQPGGDLLMTYDETVQSLGAAPNARVTALRTRSLNMTGCRLTTVSPDALNDAFYLETFDVRGNELVELEPLNIPSAVYTVYLDSNPIACTCRTRWIRAAPALAAHYSLSVCRHAISGDPVRVELVDDAEFLCKVDAGFCAVGPACDCYADDPDAPDRPTLLMCSDRNATRFPTGIDPSVKVVRFGGNALDRFVARNFPASRDALVELYLDRNRIVDVEDGAFRNVRKLHVLDLTGNLLTRLSSEVFSGLNGLRRLSVSGNRLTVVEPGCFGALLDLRRLTLHDNELSALDERTLGEIGSASSLQTLTLYGNPWDCPCDNSTFKNWIQTLADVVENASSIRCNDTPILTLPDRYFDCGGVVDDHEPRRVYVTEFGVGPVSGLAASAFVLLVVVVALIVAFRRRHAIEVALYSRFRLRLRRRKENERCDTDAFVVYDEEDRDVYKWVTENLVPGLREFELLLVAEAEPNLSVSDNMWKMIDRSKRTIFVFGGDNVNDADVHHAFQMAYDFAKLPNSGHDVVFVLTEDFRLDEAMTNAADQNLSETFLAFFTRGRCLRTADMRFWAELFYFMPTKPADNRNVNSDDQRMNLVEDGHRETEIGL